MRLYELPEAIRAVEAEIVELEGEITPEIEERLDALEEEFQSKAEYLALLAREAKAEAAAVKQEENRLKARRVAAERREKRLKAYIQHCMTSLGIDRVDSERAKVRRQRNSRPSITWMGSDDAIPEAFRKVTVEVNGRAAYDAWRAAPKDQRDQALPEGFRVEVGEHLRIS